MSGLKNKVEDIEKEFLKNAQSGLDEQFFKQIPYLFARIRELEDALIPFAQKYETEGHIPAPITNIHMKFCQRAFNVMINEQRSTTVAAVV